MAQVGSSRTDRHCHLGGHWYIVIAEHFDLSFLEGIHTFARNPRLTSAPPCLFRGMMGTYAQDYVKVRSRRKYVACCGCSSSWIWADRINAQRWGCNQCGTPWPGVDGDWKTTSSVKQARKPRGRVRPQVDPPPGLGPKTKHTPSAIESTLKKAWGTLPKEAHEALKALGIDFTPEPECPPLEEVLKAHLESLPSEVKEAVVGLIKPTPTVAVDVTGQLKATVGELRQLATKKQALQRKVDQAEDHYKILLDELKAVQEAIDKEHKQLGDQSEAYAKQLKAEAVTVTSTGDHVLDSDATEHVLKALGQAGIIFNSDQQKELERNLAETMSKRRKTDESQLSG